METEKDLELEQRELMTLPNYNSCTRREYTIITSLEGLPDYVKERNEDVCKSYVRPKDGEEFLSVVDTRINLRFKESILDKVEDKDIFNVKMGMDYTAKKVRASKDDELEFDSSETITYNATGNILTSIIKDKNKIRLIKNTYDELGNLAECVEESDASYKRTTYTYENYHLMKKSVYALKKATKAAVRKISYYEYDNDWKLTGCKKYVINE